MKLYIAEKPSLGRAIAAALPKPHKNHQGYIEVANGDLVSWCIGHILEQAEPEAYDAKFKQWKLEHLPILPQQWLLKPKTKTRSQLTVIRKLVKQATQIVHAGDPDREGQLLVDEVIDYLKVSASKKAKIQRLLISDLNTPAVKRALQSLQANSVFMPLSVSALARSRADWLYGINLTRTYTLMGKKVGFEGVLSVGRVQTPVLGLVVRRDLAIEDFVSKGYFEVLANIVTPQGEKFNAKWQPSKPCQPYMDEEGRVLVKALAQNVVDRISGQPALVTEVKKQQKRQQAPLPYSLSSLQIDAAKRYTMNAKLVLDVCQALYEKHKLITYPRSDCRYLPNEHFKQAPSIVSRLANSSANYAQAAKNADTSIKSKAWNDSKVTAHHAIIPSERSADNVTLNSFEKNVYQLIVRQYLAQFYPAHVYDQTKVKLNIAGGEFSTSAKCIVDNGWKALFVPPKKAQGLQTVDQKNDNKEQEQLLPALQQGDILHCTQGQLLEKETQPPAAFTDATLLAAMTGISRYVTDSEIKKVLKDTDGLGTEATRAGIIDLLFNRGYLLRQGKQIKATDVGKALITTLPDVATKPDMTAQWEATLNAISEKRANYQSFMEPLGQTINSLIASAREQLPTQLQGLSVKSTGPKFAKRKYNSKRKTAKTSK
jgi:DNA topoisomerase-3